MMHVTPRAASHRLLSLLCIAVLLCGCGQSNPQSDENYYESPADYSMRLSTNLLLLGSADEACVTDETGLVVIPSSKDRKTLLPYSGSIPPTPADLEQLKISSGSITGIASQDSLLFGVCTIRQSADRAATFYWAYDTSLDLYFSDVDRAVVEKECGHESRIPWSSLVTPDHFVRTRVLRGG